MGERASGVLKRRGLLAAAAALAGAGLAKLARPEHVLAGTDGDVVLGAVNPPSGTVATTTAINATVAGNPGFRVTNNAAATEAFADGIQGYASGDTLAGVFGANGSVNGIGVFGAASATNGVGIRGRADAATGTGALGLSSAGVAVSGQSSTGIGVRGDSAGSYGAYGLSQSGPGVFGGSNSGVGVYANSNETTGVFATGAQRAVWGRTGSGIGVFGQATGTGGFGVYGVAPLVPNTWAGYFEGNVYVSGRIAGGGISSTAPSSDGSPRTLYSVDSAEPVVEDFGQAQLVGGKARVALEPEFAAIVDGGAYQVFLTPEGDSKGLYVTDKGHAGFTVREQQNGTAGLPFAYRVVARRKGATGKRLERVEQPRRLGARELDPPTLPELPPRAPERRPGRPSTR